TDRSMRRRARRLGAWDDGRMSELSFRPAQQDEAPQLTELALRSKGHWGYDQDFLAACRLELTVDPAECDGVHIICAERAGQIVGYYQLAGDPPTGELADVFVDPPAIGNGTGGELLRHVLGQARQLGYERLTIDADPHAETFYRHAGARRVGDVPSGSIPNRTLPRLELSIPSTS